MNHRSTKALIRLSTLAPLGACFTIGPDHEAPATTLAPTWSKSTESFSTMTTEPAPQWWKAFQDPLLAELVDEAVARNLTLEVAALNVLEARVARRLSYQQLFPIPLAGADVTHVNLSQNVTPEVEVDVPDRPEAKTVTIGGGPLHPEGKTITVPPDISLPEVTVADELDIYSVGLDAIWELDLWGKKRRGICAANSEVDAAFATYSDVLVSLAGEVAAAYVDLRATQERRRATQRVLALATRTLESAASRKDESDLRELDALQIASLVRETESLLPGLDASESRLRNALCLLLGKPPGSLDERLNPEAALPNAPLDLAVGAPADLLRRRPDVRRAENLAAAECQRIGMARSELFPQFSLLGSIGWASSHSSNLFDGESGRGAYGGALKWNILLFTAIQDIVRVHDARYQSAIYEYQHAVLTAAREVEDACATFVAEQRRSTKLGESLEAQRRAAEISAKAYESGSLDLLRTLDAQRELVRLENDAIESRGAITRGAIAIYKALGGGWEQVDPSHILDDDTWRAMQSRTDWDWYEPEAKEPTTGESP